MTAASEFQLAFFNPGNFVELPNAKGEPVVRVVYEGEGKVRTYRRYRNILTNEMSDWQPSKEVGETEPKAMTSAMADAAGWRN